MINQQLVQFYLKLDQIKNLLIELQQLGGHLRVPDDDLLDQLGDTEQAIYAHLSSFELSAKAIAVASTTNASGETFDRKIELSF